MVAATRLEDEQFEDDAPRIANDAETAGDLDSAPDSDGDAAGRPNAFARALARISIAARIVLIVGIGLAALIGAAAIQFYANAISDRVAIEAGELRKIGVAVTDARASLFELNLITAQLDAGALDEASAAFDAALDDAIAALTTVRAFDAAAPADDRFAAAIDHFTVARPLFSALLASEEAIGEGGSDGLAGALAEAGDTLEDELRVWPGISDIMAKIAEARRFEQGLLIRYTDEGAGRLNKAISELDFFIPAGPFGAADLETIMGQLGAYRQALNALRDEAAKREDARAGIADQFEIVDGAIAPLESFAADGLERAGRDLAQTRTDTFTLFVAAGAIAVALFLIMSAFVARSINRPIAKITDAMGRLAGGDHAADVPGLWRRDEIGRMAQAIAIFKDNALEIERIRSAEQEALESAARERRETLQTLADDFERSVRRVAGALNQTAMKISDSANAMAADAEASESEGATVARMIGESADAVSMIVGSADDLGRSVNAVDSRMAETAEAINRTLRAANETTELVNSLSTAAERIGEIVDVINAIAAQTNLLALNATIEAARAGEAGRGFAVVANEVKTLATQTANATEEITGQVAAIRAEVERTVSAIGLVRDEVGVIDGLADQVSGAVRKQEEATTAIASNVSSAASGAETMSARISTMTGAVQQTARSAGGLVVAASELSDNAQRLETELDGFLVTVRQG